MRLLTKESRLNSQKSQFESLLKNGYTQDVYKGLNIFTFHDGRHFLVKIYKNTSSNHILYTAYKSEESRSAAIQQCKNNFDRNETYKAELKANPKKSGAANCSAAIKEELKNIFPGVKFSVRSDNFAGGDSVHIDYTDGPTTDQVEEITRKYQYGHFNGMEDIYEYSNNRDDLPQSKFVSVHRKLSEELINNFLPQFTELFNYDSTDDWRNTPEMVLRRIFSKTSIPVNAIIKGFEKTETMAGSFEDFYRVVFELPANEEVVKLSASVFEKVEVTAGEIQIIDYSEKAIAVIGDTKPIKDKLKELGGKFNFRLSCGAGWIFPKTKLELIQTALNA